MKKVLVQQKSTFSAISLLHTAIHLRSGSLRTNRDYVRSPGHRQLRRTILSYFPRSRSLPSVLRHLQASESTAGGRIAISTFQAVQAVDVITADPDGSFGCADHACWHAAQYVSPRGSTMARNRLEPTVLTSRGFKPTFTFTTVSRTQTSTRVSRRFLDSYEVVKGANVILSPFAPQPGGTIDYITKKPSLAAETSEALHRWNSDNTIRTLARSTSIGSSTRMPTQLG